MFTFFYKSCHGHGVSSETESLLWWLHMAGETGMGTWEIPGGPTDSIKRSKKLLRVETDEQNCLQATQKAPGLQYSHVITHVGVELVFWVTRNPFK